MPFPTMPLTPADSTDIVGKEALPSATDHIFTLPAPALTEANLARARSSRNRPIQPAVPSLYNLPPPPTRSRKIIHMTPKQTAPDSDKSVHSHAAKGAGRNPKWSEKTNSTAKKQQAPPSSAMGKKIARKTAHSVIERRRRSKMNEEFSTLKEMIPACRGQDMHKLAILQASIDYLKYLETCMGELKAANNALSTPLVQPKAPSLRQQDQEMEISEDDQDSDGPRERSWENQDRAMPDATMAISPMNPFAVGSAGHAPRSPQSLTSPSQSDIGSTKRRTSSQALTLPSPTFEKQTGHHQSQRPMSAKASTSTEVSPALMPDTAQDEEASAALLMLNNDRRHLSSRDKSKRGLSVKDLLTN